MHYFLLSFLFQVNYVLYNIPITIDRIFTDQYVRLWGAQGWADVAAILITSLAGYEEETARSFQCLKISPWLV
jgi:hypothetical protein